MNLVEPVLATDSDIHREQLKVMVMKDEAIVLTAAVIRLSPPGTNATNWHALKLHAFTSKSPQTWP